MSDESEKPPSEDAESPRRIPRKRSQYRIVSDVAGSSKCDDVESLVDIAFWSMMPAWTLEEAVALAFWRNPEAVSLDQIRVEENASFAEAYKRTRMLVQRAVSIGRLADPCIPTDFIKWASHYGIEFPEDLATAVADYNRECERRIRGEGVAQAQGVEIESMKTRNLALIILAGFLEIIYKYDPTKKSGAITEATSDLALAGITVADKTLRKYGNLGFELRGFL